MVESQPSKLLVASSILVSRSNLIQMNGLQTTSVRLDSLDKRAYNEARRGR
jgi:hypothetical protein